MLIKNNLPVLIAKAGRFYNQDIEGGCCLDRPNVRIAWMRDRDVYPSTAKLMSPVIRMPVFSRRSG